jgi:hypothetical protein
VGSQAATSPDADPMDNGTTAGNGENQRDDCDSGELTAFAK